MITPQTRTQIKGYLEGFIQGMIDQYRESPLKPNELRPLRKYSKEGNIRPFHEALLPEGILRINEFERSLSTKLGDTFEECARLLGRNYFVRVERNYKVTGEISRAVIRSIERFCNEINTSGLGRSYLDLIQEVVSINSDDLISRTRRADLYLMDKDGNETYFEIKSPKPNKGQCVEVADRLLHIHAMREAGPPRVKTYYAMAYNPYGVDKEDYKYSFALRYLDMTNQVLLGKEFWDFIGGTGSYEEILSIYQEVGQEKGSDMLDQLALNY